MAAPRLLVVQPWFNAAGHPAQSLLNTARALGRRDDIAYLVGCAREDDPRLEALRSLAGNVGRFQHADDSVRAGTWLALREMLARARAGNLPARVFFFDGHLALLALLWGMLRRRVRLDWLGILYLAGPERIAGNALLRWRMRQLLSYPELRLYLRTEELADAWRARFPDAPRRAIGVLPSLEIPDEAPPASPAPAAEGVLRVAVIGQIRRGKALEWLVPAYRQQPERGILTVAGEFGGPQARAELGFLLEYPHYRPGVLDERGLLEVAASQDYLLLLYDDWDERMEAATLYLAARVGCPVACHDGGWLARMVRASGCGVVLPRERDAALAGLAALPRPGTPDHAALVEGMLRFREAHVASALRGRYLQALLGNADVP